MFFRKLFNLSPKSIFTKNCEFLTNYSRAEKYGFDPNPLPYDKKYLDIFKKSIEGIIRSKKFKVGELTTVIFLTEIPLRFGTSWLTEEDKKLHYIEIYDDNSDIPVWVIQLNEFRPVFEPLFKSMNREDTINIILN